ncbi:MAG: hypothetical protein ACRDWH_03150 [Acidimicrobiia bacterium]
MGDLPFHGLDFHSVPSRDVEGDAADLVEVLGGRQVFAIKEGGTKVAMIALAQGPPHLLLTDHLEGERPILIYRVEHLKEVVARLEAADWVKGDVFEIPHGPCISFQTPGGHRLAVYQATRPDATSFFEGRHDF